MMCKPLRLAIILAAGLALIAGCSADVRSGKQSEGARPSPGQSASGLAEPQQQILQEHAKSQGKVDVDYIRMNLKPGLSREQVAALFGAEYKAVIHSEDGILMWRYDYADTGYQFQPKGQAIGTNIAQADLDGLRKGMIHMQLFVGWNPETNLSSYSELFYFDDSKARHRIHVSILYPDGSSTDQELPAV
jgi:hypothetical protein